MAKKMQHVIGVLIAILAIGATFSSSVMAEGTTTVSPVNYSQSNFSASVIDKSVATIQGAATLNGKLEVKFIMPHGLPQSDRHNCKWGNFAWSNWETSTGGIVWAPAGHHGWTHACLVNGVWRQIGGGPGQWNCGNVVKPMGALPPKAVKVKWSEIVVVKHFKYEVNITATATVAQAASATASCELNGVSASSSLSVTGTATASATVKAKAKSRSKAFAKAEGEAVRIVSTDESKSSLYAKARANANLQLNGQATAYCSTLKPPPPPHECAPPNPECTPPVKNPPQISCIWPPHIYVGGSQALFCEASDPNGDTVSVNIVGDAHAHVNSTIPVDERWDGSSCPSGVHCYRSTLWGKQAGVAHITATVTANGESASVSGDVNVEPDEF